MGSKRSVKSKKILDDDTLKNSQNSDSKKAQQSRMSWKLKYELINSDQFSNGMNEGEKMSSEEEETTGDVKTSVEMEVKKSEAKHKETKQKTTVIAGLSGYLSTSDSDEDSSEEQDVDINSEVQAFLKEVDSIKLDSNGHPIEENKKEDDKPTSEAAAMDQQQQAMREYYAAHGYSIPTTSWQECYDSSSGYSYYWNVETNEVRWEIPLEYQSYINSVKQQWEEYHKALYRSSQYNTAVLSQQASALVKTPASSHLPLQTSTPQNNSSLHHPSSKRETVNSSTALRGRSNNTQSKSQLLAAKKKRLSNVSDSEDEKIELITSYGPNSDDQTSEDEKDSSTPNNIKKRKSRHSHGSKENADRPYQHSKLSLVPDKGPPGVEDDSEEIERQEEIRRRLASRQEDMKKLLAMKKEEALKKKKRITETQNEGPIKKKQAVDSNSISNVTVSEEIQDVPKIPFKPDLPSDSDVPSPGEAELVERLKSQAEVLKKLGGELPEGVTRIISEQLTKPESSAGGSLVVGYDEGADSEGEEDKETSEKSILEIKSIKEDITIEPVSKADETKGDKSKVDLKAEPGERVSKKVLKLSAKAKKLIDASETTKRARQTDFISTPLGLRPATSNDNGEEKSNEDVSEVAIKTESISLTEVAAEKSKLSPISISGNESGGVIEDSSEFDIKNNSELILSKMKFLSEGKEPPSPVQIWVQQLEILLKAWEGKYLQSEFLSRWLQSLNERLTQLESSAAPIGWLCLWSREERRYCYKKVETGEVVWDFPTETRSPVVEDVATDTRDAGEEECLDLGEGQGEVEMEICLTPPPPPSPPSPPPPPSISDKPPSPPPPPTISYSSDASLPEDAPPLPDETPPPLPEEAPPPLPEDAPPLPLEEAPPLPPGEPLPPGVELPSSAPFTPSLPLAPQPVPPPAVPLPPPQSVPPPLAHRALLPHPPPAQVQPEYGHIVLTPATYHMGYHQIHYASQSQYTSAYVSAAPMPAQIPTKVNNDDEKKGDMSSELDSFYNDIAKLEPEEMEEQRPEIIPSPALPQPPEDLQMDIQSQDSPDPQPPTSSSPDPSAVKKKKKPKLAPGLALKKKGVSSLVAKWQKVQQSARRDF